MSTISYDAAGQPRVPSGASDGHSGPIAQPGASELARLRKDREMEHWRAMEENRRAVRTREDDVHERRMKEANAAREAERRGAVEADLRLDGVAEHLVKGLADKTMADWHQGHALEAANRGDRARRELEDYFRSRPAPTFDDGG